MKSQPPVEFDREATREATMEFCWWWNLFNPAVWLAGEHKKLWSYSNRFEEKWKQLPSLFAMEWSHQQHQRSAFLHEMGRRTDQDYPWKLPYVQLSDGQRQELLQRWPVDETCLGYYETGDLETVPKLGWTSYKGFSFNLNRNNKSLVRIFEMFIQMERGKLNIKNPKPNQGRINRGLSWRPVELLDFQLHRGRVLNDAERSQVSKAKRQYRASI